LKIGTFIILTRSSFARIAIEIFSILVLPKINLTGTGFYEDGSQTQGKQQHDSNGRTKRYH